MRLTPPSRQNSAGFTLLEVLIAIIIFALMATISYRGLTAILDSKRQVSAESEKWKKIAILFTRLERDFAVVVPRPVRGATQPYLDAFSGEQTAVGDNGAQLAFTRMGSNDDTSALAAPQRVGYRFRNGTVELLLWPVLDQAPRTVPTIGVLIDDVNDMKFRYFDDKGSPLARWPAVSDPNGSTVLPKAVEVTVTLKSNEVLTRLFNLPITSTTSAPPPS
ncbi:MAG: type II secretion system minor pseudopilin GspJ [Pseudomonadota bacterium]